MARSLVVVSLLLAAAVSSSSSLSSSWGPHLFAAAYSDVESDRPSSHANPADINFPPQFYVTTGTTIPFVGADPVSQTGSLYYDGINQRVRVDNFWLGNQRSFIVDIGKEKGYIVSNDQCTVLKLTGELKRYGVPDGAIRSLDPVAVRGVPVLHYTAVEKETTIQLVDFFVRPMNLSYAYDDEGYRSDEAAEDDAANTNAYNSGEVELKLSRGEEERAEREAHAAASEGEERIKSDQGSYFMPWQIRSKRLRQRTIAPPSPYFSSSSSDGSATGNRGSATDLPNWRFFGEPMDEIITAEDAAEEFGIRGPDGKSVPRGAVEKLVEDVTVTVDFFNFVPTQPAPSIFDTPSACIDQEPKHEFNYSVNVHQAQRLLVDMSFNSLQGRRLMDHLWRSEMIKRVAAGGSSAAARSAAASKPKKELPPAKAAEKNSEL